MQSIYANATQARAHIPAISGVLQDLQRQSIAQSSMDTESPSTLEEWTVVTVRDLVKVYDSKKTVINGANIDFSKNQVVGFVGASGSGKSTFAHILCGLIEATSGRLLVDGHEITRDNLKKWQKQVAFVPQEPALFNGTLLQNVCFELDVSCCNATRAESCLREAAFGDVLDSLPSGLDSEVGDDGRLFSGGQRQRIAIARALYNDRHLLVLDEPTSALDHASSKSIGELISRLSDTKTIVLVTHDRSMVEYCDRVFEFKDSLCRPI
jgi:ABC-type multidrug transport system fused ATPase/permease subunit